MFHEGINACVRAQGTPVSSDILFEARMKLQSVLSACTLVPCAQSVHALNFTGLYSLVQRQVPQHSDHFVFASLEGDGDRYIIADTPRSKGSITISCTSLSACSRGLYTYVNLRPSVQSFCHAETVSL